MTYFITGVAGFIGFHTAKKLLDQGEKVIGVDNLNDYYDPKLKHDRLDILNKDKSFLFYPIDIASLSELSELAIAHEDIEYIVHLAAQAGVRYSVENPLAYVHSNLVGHGNMLEFARSIKKLKHFVYASSSSVYGGNTKLPFSVDDKVDHPRSLYAATKKSNELMSHSYAHLFNIPSTGLRFFTVYGPWGRPDMATFLFTDAIVNNRPITVFNKGDMSRDFTYIDDIVNGILSVLVHTPNTTPPHQVYNLGNNKSENLMDFIKTIEDAIGKKATIEYKPMHPGDVKATYADIEASQKDFNFSPKTPINEGVPEFVKWYKSYYDISE